MSSLPALSLTQAVQLMGLVQCALLLAYLAWCGGDGKRRLLAGFFFLVLAANFGLPEGWIETPAWLSAPIAALAGFLAAVSYLLAGQMLEARFPPWRHFLILLVPVGGAPLLVAGEQAPLLDLCAGTLCLEGGDAANLWRVISGGVILLAVMLFVEKRCLNFRKGAEVLAGPESGIPQQRERRGLALGLVLVNLAVLGAVLAELFGLLAEDEAEFVAIAMGLAFIYLATSAMFRIFPESAQFSLHAGASSPSPDKEAALSGGGPPPLSLDQGDLALLARIRAYLTDEAPHLKENFHRGDMARALGVPEHRLSKVVNQGFGKSLIDVLNELRVAEAKRLLALSDQQITQIAFASGFNALPSFHRVFKKLAGCSPSEWRERGEVRS
ncbi:MAG: helix-turn-helix transcriptional regulator [Rhodospirillales bacterium]|nr:helix-turn-helix transcriptional regulator [Rhodospirillales bacterium]